VRVNKRRVRFEDIFSHSQLLEASFLLLIQGTVTALTLPLAKATCGKQQ